MRDPALMLARLDGTTAENPRRGAWPYIGVIHETQRVFDWHNEASPFTDYYRQALNQECSRA